MASAKVQAILAAAPVLAAVITKARDKLRRRGERARYVGEGGRLASAALRAALQAVERDLRNNPDSGGNAPQLLDALRRAAKAATGDRLFSTAKHVLENHGALDSTDLADEIKQELARFSRPGRPERYGRYVKDMDGDYKIEAEVFDEPSSYGINASRISKLWIYPPGQKPSISSSVVSYDRGWDKKPSTPQLKAMVEKMLKKYPGNIPEEVTASNKLSMVRAEPYGGPVRGHYGALTWTATVYQEPSRYGINRGRVSKLEIRRGATVLARYSRGWKVTSQDPQVLAAVAKVVERYGRMDYNSIESTIAALNRIISHLDHVGGKYLDPEMQLPPAFQDVMRAIENLSKAVKKL